MEDQSIKHLHYAGNCALSALQNLRDLTEWLDKVTDSLPEYEGSIRSMRQQSLVVSSAVREIESSLSHISAVLRKV